MHGMFVIDFGTIDDDDRQIIRKSHKNTSMA